jgi:hypothetical protein
MARATAPVLERPALTVLPGGKRLVTRPLGEAEEAWVELQAVTVESGRFAGRAHTIARELQAALVRGQAGTIAQLADELERTAPLVVHRCKHAHLEAQGKLDELRHLPTHRP